jgi:hypothetical protein
LPLPKRPARASTRSTPPRPASTTRSDKARSPQLSMRPRHDAYTLSKFLALFNIGRNKERVERGSN